MAHAAIFRSNLKLAREIWANQLDKRLIEGLKILSKQDGMSLAAGDLLILDGHWYVTHAGLLRLAERKGCLGILVRPLPNYCDSSSSRWVFKAIVYKQCSKGFVGHGDADPSNVSSSMHGAELRIAETRAVNRALRKAYGIGLCSVEELVHFSKSSSPPGSESRRFPPANGNAVSASNPNLRDRLSVLIRKYDLNPSHVKRYAAHFCGAETLRNASRELVESFVATLGNEAARDRDNLVSKLNSYADALEVKQ